MLSCAAQPTSSQVTRSCRFALYNIRRIRPFLMREAAQLLVQALAISCPRLQLQNTAARLVFNLPKFSDPSLPRPLLAPCSSSYQIQDDGTNLQGCQRNSPDPPPSTSQTPTPRLEPSAQLPRPAGQYPPSLRARKGRTAKSQLFSVLAPLMVERPLC